MFATDQPFAERWARQTTFRRLPARVATKAEETPAAAGGATPQGTGTPGKRTPAERARLAALARWGKYKGKGAKPKGKGRKPAQTPEAKEAQRRQEAQANRATVAGQMGISSDDQASIDALAMGKPPGDTAALVKAGIVELGKDGTPRLSAAGRAFYNAASRGDAGAAGDALSRGKDKATPADKPAAEAEKPKGGGGGGSSGKEKPTEDEKAKAKAEAAQQKLQATRDALRTKMADSDAGLSPSGFDAFIGFADGGALDDRAAAQLADLGLIEGDPPRLTEAGRGARNAINRGDYRGAVDAIGRGADRKKTLQERERAKADKDAAPKPKQTKRTTERRGTTVITTRATKAEERYSPPAAARSNARRGLELRQKWGRGGTAVGVARARDLSNGRDLPYRTVARMAAFNRHRGYALDGRKEPDGGPSAAYIAWLLWGGTTGVDWAREITGAKETKMQTVSQDSTGGALVNPRRPRFRKRPL